MQAFFFSFFICLNILFSVPTMAQEVFIPQTQDIPLMSDLSINMSDDMNFDTPAGQLITFEAKSRSQTGKQILNYYKKTLPEMGWVEHAHNYYTRDKDSVTMTIIRNTKPAIIRFEIILSNPN